jgi:hypothetical protein
MPDNITDASSTDSLFSSLIHDAFQFGVPLAQSVLNQQSTPAQLQAERLRDAALNGSGPNDPNLAGQAPQGLLDFISGARVTGGSGGTNTSGLRSGPNYTMIGIVVLAVVAVIFILKK